MLILGIDEEEENTEDDDKGYGDGEDDKMKKDGSYEWTQTLFSMDHFHMKLFK